MCYWLKFNVEHDLCNKEEWNTCGGKWGYVGAGYSVNEKMKKTEVDGKKEKKAMAKNVREGWGIC